MSISKDPAISVGGNTISGQSVAARADESGSTNALGISGIWEDVKQKAADIVDDIQDGLNATSKSVEEHANAIGDRVDHVYDSTKESTMHTWDATKDMAAGASDFTNSKVNDTKEKAGDTWDSTKEKAGDTWDSTKGKAGDTWDSTKGKADDSKNQSKDYANSAKEKGEAMLDRVTSRVKEGENEISNQAHSALSDYNKGGDDNAFAAGDKTIGSPVDALNSTVNSVGEKIMRAVFTPENTDE